MTKIEKVIKQPEALSTFASSDSIKWTWAARKLKKENCRVITVPENYNPQVGDVVLVRVEKISNHTRIFTRSNKFSRLYTEDIFIGVLGYRYATDAFHADTIDLSKLHLLTNAGLIGTVESHHSKISSPTSLKLLGLLSDNDSLQPINLKESHFSNGHTIKQFPPVVFVVGSGMNSGKTTSAARVGKVLGSNGFSVAMLKVTGSVSYRDLYEFESIGPTYSADFSDYGFPSTYKCSKEELIALFKRMLADTIPSKADIAVVEIADGILQQETRLLLESGIALSTSIGIILTAPSSCSALMLAKSVRHMGYTPLAVTGLITNSPLFVREFEACDPTPVIKTKTDGRRFVSIIQRQLAKIATKTD